MAGHLNAQKEPMGPTDVKEGLDSEGGHSAPEAEGVDVNGEYSSQQMLTDSECNDQVPQQGGLNPSVVAHQVLNTVDQSREDGRYPSLVAHQVPHKVDHIKDTHADVQIQGGESSTQEEAGTQPIAKAQVDINGDTSGNEVANIPLPCREDRQEDPSASHVQGGTNATERSQTTQVGQTTSSYKGMFAIGLSLKLYTGGQI